MSDPKNAGTAAGEVVNIKFMTVLKRLNLRNAIDQSLKDEGIVRSANIGPLPACHWWGHIWGHAKLQCQKNTAITNA